MIDRLMKKLEKNGFTPHRRATGKAAAALVLELIPEGADVGIGGSETIRELGLVELLRERGHNVHDHWAAGLTPHQVRAVKDRHLTCDVFLTSTNALTMEGALVNTDNTGNRVAAMAYGPGHVIVVAGSNKIVKNVREGIDRVGREAAPRNTRRRGDQTPCAATGVCENCDTPGRLCRVTTITHRKTRGVGKFSVVIVDESLGF